MNDTARFEVNKSDVSLTRWVDVPGATLADGEVRLAIGPAAMTANNISYAVMGDRFGYWNFFPVDEAEWGCVPVWAYADIAASRTEGLFVGERIYGYFPMATELVVKPSKLTRGGFVDAAAHRTGLPSVYNIYSRINADQSHRSAAEPFRTLFLPLAATAYGLADWLMQESFLGAEVVGCISASSKTALATAMLLKSRKGDRRVIGFTSAKNLAAVKAIGVYDDVVAYDDLSAIDASQRHVLIDFAGNAHFSAKLHALLGESMVHNALVGASHPDAPRKADGMNTDKSVLFFMPAYAEKRIGETDGQFIKDMTEAGRQIADEAAAWMSLRLAASTAQISALYQEVLDGELLPTEGGIIDFNAAAKAVC